MTEYIRREDAYTTLTDYYHHSTKIQHMALKEALDKVPAADVRPVVRAAWQSWEQGKPPCKWYSCDYCGFHALSRSNYCPNCGADMREES